MFSLPQSLGKIKIRINYAFLFLNSDFVLTLYKYLSIIDPHDKCVIIIRSTGEVYA